MNIHDLKEAQARYEKRIDNIVKERRQLHVLRLKFVKYFNLEKIRVMPLRDYALGGETNNEHRLNFCYTLERKLDGLGRIIGATAIKFGVYFGKTASDNEKTYRYSAKFGSDLKSAYWTLLKDLEALIIAGQEQNFKAIADNRISNMFKGKILSTYYPDLYLNVFSPDHLNYFLVQLDIDNKSLLKGDAIYKKQALVDFKNSDPVMKDWSLDIFSHFLYTEYPGRPPRKDKSPKTNDPLTDYREPDFSLNPKASYIDLTMASNWPSITETLDDLPPKIDYEQQDRKFRRLGDRGEKIVLDLEIQRLKKLGKKSLASRVDRVSLTSDGYGYDILSYDEDGSERYIEVKATTAKPGPVDFFITANEFNKSLKLRNFYIYVVFDVTSDSPKVWPIKSPFNDEGKFIKIPIKYRIKIKTMKPERR